MSSLRAEAVVPFTSTTVWSAAVQRAAVRVVVGAHAPRAAGSASRAARRPPAPGTRPPVPPS